MRANIMIIISPANNFGKISLIIFRQIYAADFQIRIKYSFDVTAHSATRKLQIGIEFFSHFTA